VDYQDRELIKRALDTLAASAVQDRHRREQDNERLCVALEMAAKDIARGLDNLASAITYMANGR
jgi:hypothetical protein